MTEAYHENEVHTADRSNCCSNLHVAANWKLNMFSLKNTNGEILNIPKTFQHKPKFLWGVIKLGLLVWTIQIMTSTILGAKSNPTWLGQLTNWQQVFISAYLTGSFVLQVIPFPATMQQDNGNGKASVLVRVVLAFYVLSIIFGFIATILFWILVYKPSWIVSYNMIMPHGITFLFVILDGMIINRIPIRLKQFIIVEGVIIAYLLWTVIHGFSFDYELYAVVDWRDKPGATAILVLIIALVAVPVAFFLIWFINELVVKPRYDSLEETEVNSRNDEVGHP